MNAMTHASGMSAIRICWCIRNVCYSHLLHTFLLHHSHPLQPSLMHFATRRPGMEKSHLERHELLFRWIVSGLVQLMQGSSDRSSSLLYVKKGVRGVSRVISGFLGGFGFECMGRISHAHTYTQHTDSRTSPVSDISVPQIKLSVADVYWWTHSEIGSDPPMRVLNITHAYGRHDSFVLDTWRLLIDSLWYWLSPTYESMRQDSFMRKTWLV